MRLQLLSFLILPFVTFASQEDQIALSANDMSETYVPLTQSQPTIADLLTIESSASIFYSYARELELSSQFVDPHAQNTLFVPTNKAVMALARKPHQSAVSDKDVVLTEAEQDALSKQNVQHWVSAHIIPHHITLATGEYLTLCEGQPISIKEVTAKSGSPAWTRVVLNKGIHIISAKEASNGIVYMIDEAVKLD
ncbi:hypothetical protein BDY19DRAFT_64496 [Irpex rosettiformis]|uniref:Uncharacterized protein n=1 Tax=Irpex rosettiformis TaxID=378272 RepID=A0ACB8UL16_9APHY|nr:hypothetical protein BDY19DRAFT_64496 [Irpex rosettiformis]